MRLGRRYAAARASSRGLFGDYAVAKSLLAPVFLLYCDYAVAVQLLAPLDVGCIATRPWLCLGYKRTRPSLCRCSRSVFLL